MLINNALIVLNVSPFYQQVALGLVLGIAIVADRIRARSRGRARRGLPVFGAQGAPPAAFGATAEPAGRRRPPSRFRFSLPGRGGRRCRPRVAAPRPPFHVRRPPAAVPGAFDRPLV